MKTRGTSILGNLHVRFQHPRCSSRASPKHRRCPQWGCRSLTQLEHFQGQDAVPWIAAIKRQSNNFVCIYIYMHIYIIVSFPNKTLVVRMITIIKTKNKNNYFCYYCDSYHYYYYVCFVVIVFIFFICIKLKMYWKLTVIFFCSLHVFPLLSEKIQYNFDQHSLWILHETQPTA